MRLARKSFCGYIALLAICTPWAITVFGQSVKQPHGTVTDSDAPIPGITVNLFSDDRVRTAVTDDDGKFAFPGQGGPFRLLEVPAQGFTTASFRIDDTTPDEFSITLSPGSCSGGGCFFQFDERTRVQYEDRSTEDQLRGTVSEYIGPRLEGVSLVLEKADLNDSQATKSFANHNISMSHRGLRYSVAAQTMSDKNGKFHFAGLDPGWYSLVVSYRNYFPETRYFWIARHTLTRSSPIELLRHGGPSPTLWPQVDVQPAPSQ